MPLSHRAPTVGRGLRRVRPGGGHTEWTVPAGAHGRGSLVAPIPVAARLRAGRGAGLRHPPGGHTVKKGASPPRERTGRRFEEKAVVMIKGNAKTKQITGRLRETLGKALGDKSMQRQGRSEQLRGKAQEMTGKAADRVRRATKH